MKSEFLNEVKDRGFLYQTTDIEALDDYLCSEGALGYVGMDVTAVSLHVGHLIPIFLMRLFQKYGHRPVILLGGGTTKIGDPSFKNTTRPILSDDEINRNFQGIRANLDGILDFEDKLTGPIMVNNADWLDHINYIPFLRDIGKFFSVNRMIGFDSVKTKLSENNSLSFLEFNYMILQAYDFYHLYKEKGCRIQFGGQDQWGNIVCGVELIRKKLNQEVFGLTVPLLVNSDGNKMGKTANGAVWLSPELLSPYDFWQYWRNVADADVVRLMYLFTDLPVNEIKKMEGIQGEELNEIKKLLADEVTRIVHGSNSLSKIHQTTAGAFGDNLENLRNSSIPYLAVTRENVDIITIPDIAVQLRICDSRSEAKRLLRSKSVYINGDAIDENYRFDINSPDTLIKLSFGKKKHVLIEIKK